jgi:hypothetical protein
MYIHRISVLFVVLLTACLPTPEPLDSGIEGIVTIGPMCPAMQEDAPCPDLPYQATMTVLTTSGKILFEFQTDEGGRFQVGLAPGEYVLHPEPRDSISFAADIPFTVKEGQFTKLEISYDSGIR